MSFADLRLPTNLVDAFDSWAITGPRKLALLVAAAEDLSARGSASAEPAEMTESPQPKQVRRRAASKKRNTIIGLSSTRC